jgi:hypothetical protein
LKESAPGQFNWRLALSNVTHTSYDFVVGDNCDFPGKNVIDALSLNVTMRTDCAVICGRNSDCTAYLLIGTGPYWCVIKKGDFKLENAQKFHGTSECGIMRSLLKKNKYLIKQIFPHPLAFERRPPCVLPAFQGSSVPSATLSVL